MKSFAILTVTSLLASPAVALAQSPAATDFAGLVGQVNSLTAALGLTGSMALPTGAFANPLAQLGLPTAPMSVLQAVLTGVPASVYAGFANPTQRASLVSEFRAGNTPAWFSSLPPEAQSYLQAIQTQVATMSFNTNALNSLGGVTLPTVSAVGTATGTGVSNTRATGTRTGTSSGSAQVTQGAEDAAAAVQVSYIAALVMLGLSAVVLM